MYPDRNCLYFVFESQLQECNGIFRKMKVKYFQLSIFVIICNNGGHSLNRDFSLIATSGIDQTLREFSE